MTPHTELPSSTAGAPWSPTRLRLLAAAVIAAALVLAAGLSHTLTGSNDETMGVSAGQPGGGDLAQGTARRDAIATEPMLAATTSDLRPASPAVRQLPALLVPSATQISTVGVATGFPHTPEGAVGQLAAIVEAALAPMSVENARTIYDAWAEDPPSFPNWPITTAIQSFHASAGTTDGDPTITTITTPVGAMIKGTDGPDWVLACVQLDITITLDDTTRFGYGHCDRMTWNQDRWTIGAGTIPATAPSTWPRSERSVTGGWRPWTGSDEGETR